MDNLKISQALELVKYVWNNDDTNSCSKLNSNMQTAVKLAIGSNMKFNDDDFINISKSFRGGYWFGVDNNGKTLGMQFYIIAILSNNPSAIKSFEKYAGIKPFITKEKHRLYPGRRINNKEYRCRVTYFDTKKGTIHLVAYDIKDWSEKGKKKLFNFNNKEWLKVREQYKEF